MWYERNRVFIARRVLPVLPRDMAAAAAVDRAAVIAVFVGQEAGHVNIAVNGFPERRIGNAAVGIFVFSIGIDVPLPGSLIAPPATGIADIGVCRIVAIISPASTTMFRLAGKLHLIPEIGLQSARADRAAEIGCRSAAV